MFRAWNSVRSSTISVVELQGVSQGNSDSGRERLRLPTASLTIVFYSSSEIELLPIFSPPVPD